MLDFSVEQLRVTILDAIPLPNLSEEQQLCSNGMIPDLQEFRDRIGSDGLFSSEEQEYFQNQALMIVQG